MDEELVLKTSNPQGLVGSIPTASAKVCWKCQQRKSLEEFSWENQALGKRQRRCRDCQKTLSKDNYKQKKERYLLNAKQRRVENQSKINAYLYSHPCVECGETDIDVLDFDHLGNKDIAVNKMLGFSSKRLQDEIDKCQVQCVKCHRRKTMKEQQSIKWYLQQDKEKDQSLLLQTARAKFQRSSRFKAIKIVFDYLNEHPCVDCGEKDLLILEFDHISDKVETISVLLYKRYWDLDFLKTEMSKCEVRCVKCHRKKTLKQKELLS